MDCFFLIVVVVVVMAIAMAWRVLIHTRTSISLVELIRIVDSAFFSGCLTNRCYRIAQIFLQSINLSLEDNGNRNDLGQDSSPRSMTPISPTPSIQISSRRKPIDEDFQEKLEEYEKDLAIKLKNYGANKGSVVGKELRRLFVRLIGVLN